MRRKKNSRLDIRIRALKVPRGMDPKQYLRQLLKSVDSGRLPRGFDVELYWRNPETRTGRSKHWQSDDFISATQNSSDGFNTLLKAMIRRRLSR